jgi:hypothetical protein
MAKDQRPAADNVPLKSALKTVSRPRRRYGPSAQIAVAGRGRLAFRADVHRLLCRFIRQCFEALSKKADDTAAQLEHRNPFDVERSESPILWQAKSSCIELRQAIRRTMPPMRQCGYPTGFSGMIGPQGAAGNVGILA